MNQLPNPESFPTNRARIDREIVDAAKDHKTVLTTGLREDLVEIVVAECTELRERIAERILGVLIDRGDGLTQEQLEKLAHIVLFHYETNDGYIDVVQPTEPKRPALRRI